MRACMPALALPTERDRRPGAWRRPNLRTDAAARLTPHLFHAHDRPSAEREPGTLGGMRRLVEAGYPLISLLEEMFSEMELEDVRAA